MTESKLQMSEVFLDNGDHATVTPDGGNVRLVVEAYKGFVTTEADLRLTPEDAYRLGGSLKRWGLECGFDPETGETA